MQLFVKHNKNRKRYWMGLSDKQQDIVMDRNIYKSTDRDGYKNACKECSSVTFINEIYT